MYCCNLPNTVVHCRVQYCSAVVHLSVLSIPQCTHCHVRVLPCSAVYYRVLPCSGMYCSTTVCSGDMPCNAVTPVYCSVLLYCSVLRLLQCSACTLVGSVEYYRIPQCRKYCIVRQCRALRSYVERWSVEYRRLLECRYCM
jgi:hypothetical protein